MDGQPPSEHRALVVGVEGPAADLVGEEQPEWPPLPFAAEYTGRLRDTLRFFGYRAHDAEEDPSGSAAALERAVESVLEAGPGFVLQESVRLFDFHRVAGYLRSPALAAVLDPHVPRA
ncbi:hypothetical protein AB0A94_03685 [Streptomyces sp. NPDC044984]|uniref:hypothetical protein n=1 Tax=Streptomyces sp. NPDC044984 TaxID=3154335 RepID=UPI0033DAADCB